MYSPTIIQRNVERIEKRTGITLKRYDLGEIDTFLEGLRTFLDQDGKPRRALKQEEADFIRNEQLLCGVDFLYWAERYPIIMRDGAVGGGSGRFEMWETQRIVFRIVQQLEEEIDAAVARDEPTDGIRVVWHKARQLGATMFWRMLVMHRVTLLRDRQAMAASVDEDKLHELYARDQLILNSLPFFLKPNMDPKCGSYDVKDEHIFMGELNSGIIYQQSQQKTGMGTGRQLAIGHLTEVAMWQNPIMIQYDYIPTIPQGRRTLVGLESTADGRGNFWHEFTEDVRKGLQPGWTYVFVPYYAEPLKYRRTPPPDWKPSQVALEHAHKVYESSGEFYKPHYMLPREQLYWWETEREAYRRRNSLNLFLTNYCATPEESFQHRERSLFPAELLDELRRKALGGMAYEYSA